MPLVHDAINDAVSRTIAIVGLAAIALIHVLQLPDAFSETFYLGVLFVGAVVVAVALSASLTRTSDHRVWLATAALPTILLLGFLLSRTTGLPDATNDVGEWDEPLGLASMVVEALVVCVGGGVLTSRPQTAARAAADIGDHERHAPARPVAGMTRMSTDR